MATAKKAEAEAQVVGHEHAAVDIEVSRQLLA